jgi:putative membrane protein
MAAGAFACGERPQPQTPETTGAARYREQQPGQIAPSQAPTVSMPESQGPASPAPSTLMSPTTTTGQGSEAATAEEAMNDAQILQLVHAANQGEIKQANLAQQKAQNGSVKKLARMISQDHAMADAKGNELTQKLNLTLATSPLSTRLENDAQALFTEMQPLSGAEFDKKYVDAQITMHEQVLKLIDDKLVPNAKSSDVKQLVSMIRPKIDMHLTEARNVKRQLR